MPSLFASLRGRLMLLVIAAGIPVTAFIFFTGLEQQKSALLEIRAQASQNARRVSVEEQGLFEGARQALVILSSSAVVAGDDPAACTAFLSSLLDQQLRYVNIGLTDADGALLCSAAPAATTTLADDTSFQQAVERGAFTVGRYGVGRITDQTEINLFYPVARPAGGTGVLFVTLDLSWMRGAAEQARVLGRGSFSLVGPDGASIVSYPPADTWVRSSTQQASALPSLLLPLDGSRLGEPGPDGSPYLFGSATLRDGSTVRIGLPATLAAEAQQRMLLSSLLILVAVKGRSACPSPRPGDEDEG